MAARSTAVRRRREPDVLHITLDPCGVRRPRLWQDPFEHFLSKTVFIRNGHPIGFDLTNDFLGQCWTLREQCDGLWRNYCGSSLSAGVRIETTAGKLLQAIWNSRGECASLQAFVRKVVYLDDEELKAVLQGCGKYGHWLTSRNGNGRAKALLMKRTEFSYEHEARALVSVPERAKDITARRLPVIPPTPAPST